MTLPIDSKFSLFTDGGDLIAGDTVVGLRGGKNTKFNNTGGVGTFLPLLGGTMLGAINMGGFPITNITNLGLNGYISQPNFIQDSFGNPVLAFGYAGSVSDYLAIGNGLANQAILRVLSSNPNASWSVLSKGSGGVYIGSETVTTAPLVMQSNGNTFTFSVPTWTGNNTLTFPDSNVTLVAGTQANAPVNSNITSMTGLTGYLASPLGFKDTSGNVMLGFTYADTPTDNFEITNGVANQASLSVNSSNTNASGSLYAKGNGGWVIAGGSTSTIPMLLGNTVNTFGFSIPTWTGNRTLTLPDANVTLVSGTMLSNALTSADFFVGNGSNVATGVAMSGDASLANTGAVTVSKIGGVAISLAGSFTTTGAHTVNFTFSADTSVTFPTTGTLATTAGTVTNATNIATTAVGTNATWFPLFVASSSNGYQAASLAASGFGFNPSTGLLSCTGFSGPLTGNVTGNVSGSSGSCTGNAATASAVAVGGITGLGTGVAIALAANVNGSGAIALTTSPTFVTPVLGAANATSINFGGSTLSAYATGSWTPIDGSGASLSFTLATGSYIKIGNLVWASCQVTYPATVSSSQAIIGGLPFSTGSTLEKQGGNVCYTTSATMQHILTTASNTIFSLFTAAGGSVTNATMSGVASYFQIVYSI